MDIRRERGGGYKKGKRGGISEKKEGWDIGGGRWGRGI